MSALRSRRLRRLLERERLRLATLAARLEEERPRLRHGRVALQYAVAVQALRAAMRALEPCLPEEAEAAPSRSAQARRSADRRG